jgi:PAS domain S-box-containing protein
MHFLRALRWSALLGVLSASTALAASQGADVLFLNSYHPGLRWSDDIMAGARSTLLGHERMAVEYLDSKHEENPRVDRLMADLLRHKYGSRRPEMILSSDDYALRFLMQWHDSLFPGVPVVFCGVNDQEAAAKAVERGFVGIHQPSRLEETIETARSLLPTTTDLWFVTESSATGTTNRRRLDSLAARSARGGTPLRFHFFDSAGPPSWTELTRGIASLGPGNAVYWSEFYRDRDSLFIDLEKDLRPFLDSVHVPVFAHQEMFVQVGALGGICNRGFEHGRQAGRLMRAVLGGERSGTLPVQEDSSVAALFDWPAVERFGIHRHDLPEEAILLREPIPIWQSYPLQTALASLLVLFLAGMLVGLTVALGRVRRSRQALVASESALRDSESGLRRLFDSMSDAVIVHSDEGEILFMNKGGQRMYGLPSEDLSKHDIMALSSLEALAGIDVRATMERASQGEDQVFEWRARQPLTGLEFEVEVSLTRISLRGHQRLVAVVRDVRERAEARRALLHAKEDLERQVEERTRALVQANRELEAFSYSVSHDLRAPLRSINGFAQALGEDLEPTLSAEHSDFLARIRNASERMGEIIDDLLHLSHITTSTLERTEVDMERLVDEVAKVLGESAPSVTWKIEALHSADGDLALLKPLWTNLLSNAVKYSAREERPVVEVSSSLMEGKPVWTVRDNGAGFDMAHAHHLFLPFRRLHHTDEFKGTGIGLAIVHRIVTRHGGKVWAEAAPGEGASFHFTLG